MQPNMERFYLNKSEIYTVLDRTKEGVLSTVGKDGYPYGTPVNFVRIDDAIYFHGRKVGEKVDNIKACDKVCLTAMILGGFEHCGPDGCNTTSIYESVIVRGTVSEVTDTDEKIAALKATIAKLTPERVNDPMNKKLADVAAIYRIGIDSATGKYHRPMAGNRIMH
ncbi:MAG: pyridoxamine 5'-phosphate oxidase family protein [Candidatus Methanomethylophilaceae archaeon]